MWARAKYKFYVTRPLYRNFISDHFFEKMPKKRLRSYTTESVEDNPIMWGICGKEIISTLCLPKFKSSS